MPYLNHAQALFSVTCAVDLSPVDVSTETEQALSDLTAEVRTQYDTFCTDLITPAYKRQLLGILLRSLETCVLHLEAQEPALFSRQNSDRVTADYFLAGQNPTAHQHNEFRVYDGFFRQYRTPKQGVVGFLREFLTLYHAMVLDLRDMEMPGVEYAHMMRLLLQVLELLRSKHRGVETVSAPLLSASIRLSSPECFDMFWSEHARLQDKEVQIKIAFYRWFCGHQLWNSALHFASAYIQTLLQYLETVRPESTPSETLHDILNPVFVMMRGFLSLIWYTLSFPSRIYTRHISPAMLAYSAERGSKGLSGATGQDYSYYAKQVRRLHAALLEYYRVCPDETWRSALDRLQHYDLLFHEHHLILASEKVDLEYYSILQRLSGIAEKPSILPAVTGMRERYLFLANRYKKAWSI